METVKPWYMEHKWWLVGGVVVLLVLLLTFCGSAQAQDTTDTWTEFDVTVFDKIDGDFSPRLTGAFINFNDNKGLGAFLGEGDAVGPIFMWRLWNREVLGVGLSFFVNASTDVSNAAEDGLFANGDFGVEPRLKIDNKASIGLGVWTASFVEGEKAQWTPYVKLVFRP